MHSLISIIYAFVKENDYIWCPAETQLSAGARLDSDAEQFRTIIR